MVFRVSRMRRKEDRLVQKAKGGQDGFQVFRLVRILRPVHGRQEIGMVLYPKAAQNFGALIDSG